MNHNHYSLASLKQAVKYLLKDCFFSIGSQIFRQVIGISMGSDPVTFSANLLSFHYESE